MGQCAKRPLTAIELEYAFAVEENDTFLDKRNFMAISDLVTLCAGLVIVEQASGIVCLVHYTAQEYFERTWQQWFPDASRDITQTCLTYLSMQEFADGVCDTDEAFEERLNRNKLYDYAANYWGGHARADKSTNEASIAFLECQPNLEASCQALRVKSYNVKGLNASQKFLLPIQGIHLAAHFGLEKPMQHLLRNCKVDTKDGRGWTPFLWVAHQGQKEAMKLLHDNGADIEVKCEEGQTSLMRATEMGTSDVIKLLIEWKANIEARDQKGRTSLVRAVKKSSSTVISLLVNQGADLEAKDHRGQTPLIIAAKRLRPNVTGMLLDRGADINAMDVEGNTPRIHAIIEDRSPDCNGYEDNAWSRAPVEIYLSFVKLLLDRGASIEKKGNDRMTPLLHAIWSAERPDKRSARNRKELNLVMKLLIEHGADIEARYIGGQTPLMLAIRWAGEHLTAVRLLLDKGADTETKDENGETSLIHAIRWGRDDETAATRHSSVTVRRGGGSVAVIRLLLDHGADIEAKDQYGRTPLWQTFYPVRRETMNLLIDRGADIAAKDEHGKTLLHLFSMIEPDEIMQRFIGDNLEVRDNNHMTPLSVACLFGNIETMRLLVEAGSSVHSQDSSGRTYLHTAATTGHAKVVRFLLEKEVDAECVTITARLRFHSRRDLVMRSWRRTSSPQRHRLWT